MSLIECDDDKIPLKFGSLGACDALLQALTRYEDASDDVIEHIWYAISGVGRSDIAKVLSFGAFDALMRVFTRRRDAPGVIQKAFYALEAIFCDEAIESKLESAGFFEELVQILIRHKNVSCIVNVACCILCRLTLCFDANQAKFGSIGCCEALVPALARHVDDVDVVYGGCHLVAILCDVEANIAKLVSAGCCEALMHILTHHLGNTSESFVSSSCHALHYLSRNDDAICYRLLSLGYCEALVQVLTRHQERMYTILNACWCIHELSRHAICKESLKSVGCIAALEGVKERYPDDDNGIKYAFEDFGI